MKKLRRGEKEGKDEEDVKKKIKEGQRKRIEMKKQRS